MTQEDEFGEDSEFPEVDGVPLTMDSLEQVDDDEIVDADRVVVAVGEDENTTPGYDSASLSAVNDSGEPVGAASDNLPENGVQEPEEGVERIPESDFTRFLMEEFGESEDSAADSSDAVEDSAVEETEVNFFDVEEWGILGWRVEPSRDEDGKLLKGEAARANPGSLVLENDDGEIMHSILLTPQVRQDLNAALVQLGKIYADPVAPSKTVKDRFNSFVQWHLEHKILGSISAFFILAFVTFVMIGFFTVS